MCDKYYDLPDTKSQRGAGFGYSSKYDFTKGIEKTPDPTKYLIKSDFEKNWQRLVQWVFENQYDAKNQRESEIWKRNKSCD